MGVVTRVYGRERSGCDVDVHNWWFGHEDRSGEVWDCYWEVGVGHHGSFDRHTLRKYERFKSAPTDIKIDLRPFEGIVRVERARSRTP